MFQKNLIPFRNLIVRLFIVQMISNFNNMCRKSPKFCLFCFLFIGKENGFKH